MNAGIRSLIQCIGQCDGDYLCADIRYAHNICYTCTFPNASQWYSSNSSVTLDRSDRVLLDHQQYPDTDVNEANDLGTEYTGADETEERIL